MADGKYSIGVESIEITPAPNWIMSDVRTEAMMLGSLSDLNIKQEDLTLRIAQAFSLHPWVAKVKRVSKKYPARVVVELQYRQPAAVVEMAQGLYPVDTEGVLLPTSDFRFVCTKCGTNHPVDIADRTCPTCSKPLVNVATQYPRLWASETAPMGQPGAPWGDPRIQAGARLATLMRPIWNRLGFYRIVARRPAKFDLDRPVPAFELITRNNTHIYWGRAPGEEFTGEPTADKKIARLIDFVRKNGSLDVLEAGRSIDLRDADKLQAATKEEALLLE